MLTKGITNGKPIFSMSVEMRFKTCIDCVDADLIRKIDHYRSTCTKTKLHPQRMDSRLRPC